ncbi:TOBE domain-containing protein [Demequina sp. SYSU T00039]|uniref:TOBE domain-containing protein n=1 Tax=Demequina lignilytica TaxID=3051663 RepID=A0AAW7M3Q4_9MICO|nr:MULTISPECIES: TOBE domain-containing protein [unclassified Demequina]MDN4478441.1 TOBE domain-containing protein [Demequina sp. SYSU T00039-1]MDN4487052.1 TOBE domain-containing protein [Demequina sp. SYSU T00039]MDN4489763.1 TOBE domain-containing protein [Demequina sp. SYSU T00068]
MPDMRISEAAELLGVSDDTVRRWVQAQGIPTWKDESNRTVIPSLAVAQLARESRRVAEDAGVRRSARNQFVGIVTAVTVDTVMAQVEMQCGPHRVVSLMSAEAVRELGLEPGSVATAVVKATTVIVETPAAKA